MKNPNSCHFQLNQTEFQSKYMWKPLFTVFIVLHCSSVINDNTPMGTNNICFSVGFFFFGILCHVVRICSTEKSLLDVPCLCVSMSSNPHTFWDVLDTLWCLESLQSLQTWWGLVWRPKKCYSSKTLSHRAGENILQKTTMQYHHTLQRNPLVKREDGCPELSVLLMKKGEN